MVVRFGDGTTAAEFPDTVVAPGDRSYEGTFELTSIDSDNSDATRMIGTLSPDECVTIYWPVRYQVLDDDGNAVWGAANDETDDLEYQFVVWSNGIETSGSTVISDTLTKSVFVRNEITASANKISPSGSPGGATIVAPSTSVAIGELISVTYLNANFGSVGDGFDLVPPPGPDNDAFIQPAGESSLWNPDVLRLVRIEGELRGSNCGGSNPPVTLPFVDEWYFSDLNQYGGCRWEADYTYTFLALSAGTSVLAPYQEVASGSDNEKYNGGYCGDDGAGAHPDVCVPITVDGDAPGPVIDKAVDAATADTDDTLTYTLTYTNEADAPIGNPSTGNGVTLNDPLPAGIAYVSGSATCSTACTIYFSTDGGTTFSTVEPVPASAVTNLRWHIETPVPAMTSGTVGFQATVTTTQTITVTNTATVTIDGGPAIDSDSAETEMNPMIACLEDCSLLDDTCNQGVCNTDSGLCEASPLSDGTSCDDGDLCTDSDQCSAGVCLPGGPVDCTDGNSCTLDTCDPLSGCNFSALGGCTADLGIECLDGPDAVSMGDLLGYTAIVGNYGEGIATDAEALLVFDLAAPPVELYLPAGCTVAADDITVTCVLGDLAPGVKVRLNFVVAVATNAPSVKTGTSGSCSTNGDLCLACSTSTSAVDANPANDASEQPSDVVESAGFPLTSCGNGVVDPGEDCDDPSAEDCANGFDDDGDGWVDWSDLDCNCGTGAPAVCSSMCSWIESPNALLKDPQRLRFYDDGRPDRYQLHATIEGNGPIDQETEGAHVRVSDSEGAILFARLYPGDLKRRKWGWIYSDRSARHGGGPRGGVVLYHIRDRSKPGGPYIYPVRIVIRDNFTAGSHSEITTDLKIGNQSARLFATWRGKAGERWQLRDREILDWDPCLAMESPPGP